MSWFWLNMPLAAAFFTGLDGHPAMAGLQTPQNQS
jgi:hypothetical protein